MAAVRTERGRADSTPPAVDGRSSRPTALYVLIPPSPLFAAHWSFFLPDLLPCDAVSRRQEESERGRRIHVSGDRLNGFSLQIVRDYNVRQHRGLGSRSFPIALVHERHLRRSGAALIGEGAEDLGRHRYPEKDEDEGGGFVDNEPIDAFERVCLEVEAPGPSLNSANIEGKRKRTEVRDCQWWIRRVVEVLVSRDMLLPLPCTGDDGKDADKDALYILSTLPAH